MTIAESIQDMVKKREPSKRITISKQPINNGREFGMKIDLFKEDFRSQPAYTLAASINFILDQWILIKVISFHLYVTEIKENINNIGL